MSTRSIPWPRIFAEALAIVVSILLAFGIQAWWEERQDRAVEQALLAGLVEDLRLDSADYAGFAAVHRGRVRGADFLLSLGTQESAVRPGSSASGEEMTPGRAFQLVGRFARLETVRVSYDQITAAGMSDVISDPDLRRKIAQYYAAAADRTDVDGFQNGLSQRLELSLREFGYLPSDGDPVPDAILSDRAVRADLRSIRNASRGAANSGTEMLQLATDLMNAAADHLR
jgi:hypothetical protein